jgi:hypothetical protein
MQSVCIKYAGDAKEDVFVVEIICECGEKQLRNDSSLELSQSHKAVVSTTCSATAPFSLSCPTCGRGFGVNPQGDQFWMNDIRGPKKVTDPAW